MTELLTFRHRRTAPGVRHFIIFMLLIPMGSLAYHFAAAQAGEISVGQTVEVVTSGQNLNLRSGPGTNYGVVARLSNGTRMLVIDGPVSADDYTWWKLEGPPGQGWAAGAFLRPGGNVPRTNEAGEPAFVWPLAAPWPGGITLHAAGDGYGYGEETHSNTDRFAMDFNGWPNLSDPPVEYNDEDVLVLSVADGCVKSVEYNPGRYVGEKWLGNYGWNVVISHFGGFEVRYAHLRERPLVEDPRQSLLQGCDGWVAQGQPLGQIGGSGTENDSAVHLHLAIYYCDPSNGSCQIQSVRPEPLDGVSPLLDNTKITSRNFSVGHEAIQGEALTDPELLRFHKAIYDEYKYLGGQRDLFGRAATPVLPIQLGSQMYYQAFAPHALMSTFATSVLEHEGRAYMIPNPIFDAYVRAYPAYGTPNSPTYVANQSTHQVGWRTDFSQASLFWHWGLSNPVVWDKSNAPWAGTFCPGKENFNCDSVDRRDPYIDFSFSDSNNSGPLRASQGFSAAWEASLDGGLLSSITLDYEVQGHARIFIDGKPQGAWISSEDSVTSGSTRPTWLVGGNTFVVLFWQAPGKPARLRMTVEEKGLIAEAKAFESQGTLASVAYQPLSPAEYANFEPPPFPGEESSLPGIPPDLGKSWDNLISGLEQALDRW